MLLVRLIAQEDARDDRETLPFGPIHELEVPPLEEWGPTTMAVVALRVEQVAENDDSSRNRAYR
jgi:hypothetical protein